MPQAAGDEALKELVVDLYEAYYRPLFAYVYRLVGEAQWAQDLVQETFLRLYRERQKLAKVQNHRAWAYRMASNVTFTALRRGRRGLQLSWQQVEALAPPRADPTAAAGEEQIALERALASLPPHYRARLLLHSYCGFPIADVAAALELTETAVTTRIYRAKKMFREAYEPTQERGNKP